MAPPHLNDDANGALRKALLVIVTYNSFELLPNVVGAVRAFIDDHPGNHAIVVENSADPRVPEFVESALGSDRVAVHVAVRNEGFSPAVNLGYRMAKDLWGSFDYIVLMNPDVIAAGRVLCNLVRRASPGVDGRGGIWGAVLRDENGHIDRGCARRVWNRRRLFSHVLGYPELVRALRTTPRSLSENEINSDQSELAMVSGGLMCISADVFDHGLDTHLPMYLEDQEICMRTIIAGRPVRLHPDLELLHVGGVSRKSTTANERALRIMELVESPALCMTRFQGYSFRSLRLTILLGGICRFVAASAAGVVKMALGREHLNDRSRWSVEQRRLARWIIVWSVRGPFHTKQVTLEQYLKKYSVSA